jgi:hypothetical protein
MPAKPLPGLYTVKTPPSHTSKDLTFAEAMRLIQDRFEQHGSKLAVIERQA